jgi:hypothetical protein
MPAIHQKAGIREQPATPAELPLVARIQHPSPNGDGNLGQEYPASVTWQKSDAFHST